MGDNFFNIVTEVKVPYYMHKVGRNIDSRGLDNKMDGTHRNGKADQFGPGKKRLRLF